MGHSVVRLPRSHPKMPKKRISTTVSHKVMNQLSFLCEHNRRPQNNMLEYLVIQEFARVVESMPTDEREHIVREVFHSSTYVSAF